MLGGLLMAPSNRFSGAVGGAIAGPMGLLAVYFYARNRQVIYTIESFIVMMIASLPGLGVYFLLRLVGNAMFPPPRPREEFYDDDEDDYDDRPRRSHRRDRDEEDDDEEDDRPRSRRRRDRDEEEDEDDDRPRRRRIDRGD